jgi:hypothetical protein
MMEEERFQYGSDLGGKEVDVDRICDVAYRTRNMVLHGGSGREGSESVGSE